MDAARKLGIEIPTLCFLDGLEPITSCMVCVVRIEGRESLQPACAAPAEDGMRVASDCDEVRHARRTALELLLSEHLGDCQAPCHSACPAGMDIPRMIRHIAAGRLVEAAIVVKADIALPAVLGRICPAPCEKACRRQFHDAPLAICLLKRYAADADLAAGGPWLPACKPDTGRRIAVVGSGPAGLAAVYHLRILGHACTIFDEHELPGGMLRYGVGEDALDRAVLDAEIDVIRKLGAEFRMDTKVGADVALADLRRDFDAVAVAVGQIKGDADRLGLDASPRGVQADAHTRATSAEGVFAGGGAVRPSRLAVRAVQDGKAIAASIDQHLAGRPVTGLKRPFTVHIGRPREGEMPRFLAEGSDGPRQDPGSPGQGLSDEQARAEAARCLHCDCRKPDACKLRIHADAYGASPGRYKAERGDFEQLAQHPSVLYESGKCIRCGLCVKISERSREALGLTFIGRGFDVRVAVPFEASLADGLRKVGAECVRACPTGALAFKADRQEQDGPFSNS